MDYATAAANPVFQKLATEGVLLKSYYALTHPSEPSRSTRPFIPYDALDVLFR
jgi:hypothetical protein